MKTTPTLIPAASSPLRPVLRRAQSQDVPALRRLTEALAAHWGDRDQSLPAADAAPAEEVIVAETGAGIVGFVALERAAGDQHVLRALFVLPDEREQGLGSALIEAAVALARRMGAVSVGMAAPPDHAGLAAFLARRGFVAPAAPEADPHSQPQGQPHRQPDAARPCAA